MKTTLTTVSSVSMFAKVAGCAGMAVAVEKPISIKETI